MLDNLGYAAAYSALGAALLGLGFVLLDVLTPDKLASHIWKEGSINAALVLAAGFLGQGAIIFTAIWTNSASGFGTAFANTAAFGALGVFLQAAVFGGMSLATRKRLAETVCMVQFHPASLVSAAVHLVIGAIVCASIA